MKSPSTDQKSLRACVFCFVCWLRLLRTSLKVSSEIFTPYRFSDSMISARQFTVPSAIGKTKCSPILGVISFCIASSSKDFRRVQIVQLLDLCNQKIFPNSPRDAYPRNVPGNTYQIDGALTGLLQKSDDVLPLRQTE